MMGRWLQMSDFLRPELRDALMKYRDVLIGLALAVVGAWWSATAHGAVAFIGYAAVGLGIVLMIGGWQRMRFHSEGQGPGVIQIVERRLAYLGPLTGGVMEMDDAVSLALEPQSLPAPHWIITDAAGKVLEIPVNAEGSDALFDLFAALPGMRTEVMLAALDAPPPERQVIWQRTATLIR